MPWPRLDHAADEGTIESLHLLLQLIGKLPLRLHPWVNHGWHVALRPSPRGFATRSLPAGERHSRSSSTCSTARYGISATTVRNRCWRSPAADRRRAPRTDGAAETARLPAPLHGGPNEMPDPVRFAEDRRAREVEPGRGRRLHGAFLCADRGFNRFRSLYRGKSSPSHLVLGQLRPRGDALLGPQGAAPSGRRPGPARPVTREAYSHEVISAGFWPGGQRVRLKRPSTPTPIRPPVALAVQPVAPDAAFWHASCASSCSLRRGARSGRPRCRSFSGFLHSTFDAAAGLLDWPPGLVIDEPPSFGRPPA
jgi:hypothetical protein